MPCKIKRKGGSHRSKKGLIPAKTLQRSGVPQPFILWDIQAQAPSSFLASVGRPFLILAAHRSRPRKNHAVKVVAEFSQPQKRCPGTKVGSTMLQSWSDDEDPRSSWVEMGTRLQPPVTPLIPVLDSPLGPFLFYPFFLKRADRSWRSLKAGMARAGRVRGASGLSHSSQPLDGVVKLTCPATHRTAG